MRSEYKNQKQMTEAVLRIDDFPGIEEFVAIRRDIHQHSELAYEEHRSSAKVSGLIRQCGYTVTPNLGGTGVVGELFRGNGPKIGLRADMDALSIPEVTGATWSSAEAGAMHNMAGYAQGALLFRTGSIMASSCYVTQ